MGQRLATIWAKLDAVNSRSKKKRSNLKSEYPEELTLIFLIWSKSTYTSVLQYQKYYPRVTFKLHNGADEARIRHPPIQTRLQNTPNKSVQVSDNHQKRISSRNSTVSFLSPPPLCLLQPSTHKEVIRVFSDETTLQDGKTGQTDSS